MTEPISIIGHSHQREALARLQSSTHMPSTLMFAGNSGVGKRLVATELARSLLCKTNRETPQDLHYGGCSSCENCRLFDSGNIADYHYLECSSKEVSSIATLRDLLYSLSLRPFGGGNRVVIFNDAEHLTIQAANLLLKTLEEPRSDTYFVLVTSGASRLPATLRSRCQVWYFDALSPEEIISILAVSNPDASKSTIPAHELALLADGSLSGIQEISDQYEQWQVVSDTLQRIASGDSSVIPTYALKLSKDKDSLHSIFQLMRIFARQRLLNDPEPKNKLLWAAFLRGVLDADWLIKDRHMSALPVLNLLLSILSSQENAARFTLAAKNGSLFSALTAY